MLRATAGIVGLPNVGKSTLFNALTRSQAAVASNFPFCTIEPNVARVLVPDDRLDVLARLAGSAKTFHAGLELHDIAGLIKGASRGEGLGNQFLGNIRNVSMIVNVLRCYHDHDIVHVAVDEDGKSDPVADLETVETELMLADLALIERRLGAGKRKGRTAEERDILEKVYAALSGGKPAIEVLSEAEDISPDIQAIHSELTGQLLTAKPVLYLCNTDEEGARNNGNELTLAVANELKRRGNVSCDPVIVCAKLEEEALSFFETEEERMGYLSEFGIKDTALSKIAGKCARLLNQSVFYTVGPKETRAWSIPTKCRAQDAAGKIHSDIKRGFIAAETIDYNDFVKFNGEQGAKEAGKIRMEGRDYLVKNGDIINFKFNV